VSRSRRKNLIVLIAAFVGGVGRGARSEPGKNTPPITGSGRETSAACAALRAVLSRDGSATSSAKRVVINMVLLPSSGDVGGRRRLRVLVHGRKRSATLLRDPRVSRSSTTFSFDHRLSGKRGWRESARSACGATPQHEIALQHQSPMAGAKADSTILADAPRIREKRSPTISIPRSRYIRRSDHADRARKRSPRAGAHPSRRGPWCAAMAGAGRGSPR